NYTPQALVHCLERTLRAKNSVDNPLKDRMVMMVGLTAAGRALGHALQRRGANVIVCSHQRKAGLQLAQELNCRAIQFEALYSTSHDVLVVCDEEKEAVRGATGIHSGYLKPGMTVLDLTATLRRTPLLKGAADHGCLIADPRDLLLDQLQLYARKIAGKETPRDVLLAAVPEYLREE